MDPSAFMGNAAQFNAAQFNPQQQQQHQQHHLQQQQQHQQQLAAMQMQNGGPMRNASPTFQNSVYQTNSVVPSKRPRPREDSLAGSPRPNPGMLPTARSETPQQFPGYQPGGMSQQTPGLQQPSQYPHLQQNGSSNATPSPIMGNNMRPGSVPQRVATASPHSFSPGGQQFAPQASPVQSEHGTPQPNPYMQNMPPNMQSMQNAPQGFNPNGNFTPTPSPARPSPNPNAMGNMMPQQMGGQMPQQMPQQMGQMPGHMYPPNMPQRSSMDPQQIAAYQARLQKQLQAQGNPQNMHPNVQQNMQMAAQMQAQNMGQGRGMPPKAPMQMPNGQMPPGGMRPQQRGIPQEQFMKSLSKFMQAKGLPLETNAVIANRPVNLLVLFQAVQSKGGYKPTTVSHQWPNISNAMGFHPGQMPQAPQLLKELYERNLARFEEVWVSQQNQQRMMQQGMQTPNTSSQPTPNRQMSPQGQTSPQGQMAPGQQPPQMHPGQVQTPIKQSPYGGPSSMNGMPTPQGQMPINEAAPAQGHARPSHSRGMETSPGPGQGAAFPLASPAQTKQGILPMPPGPKGDQGRPQGKPEPPKLLRMAESNVYQPDVYAPREDRWGGVELIQNDLKGMVLESLRPDVPSVWELGQIDIQALTRSIESGIHSEVRMALDTLATVSLGTNVVVYIQLKNCEDLVDALIDCAEEQLEQLAENTVEVSDEIQLASYEDVARACWVDEMNIRHIPVAGSSDYDLDRAVDRLTCIFTILRNLSFPAPAPISKDHPYPEENNENASVLADESVIKFLCVLIRYLGTRTMLLRTHANTLEFMKDAIVFLANIAGAVEIPGREQALCLLHFLLAFAPSPGPSTVDGQLFFPPFEHGVHTYLLYAVNALTNFLARDEPNRTHYKTLFALDANSSPPYELLTKTFALAISVLPLQAPAEPPLINQIIDANTPWLMQGLLAADILASLAPGQDSGLAKSWLASGNGFAQGLYHLIRAVGTHYDYVASKKISRDNPLPYVMSLGFSTLRKLADKARDPNCPASFPADAVPSSDSVFKMLQTRLADWVKDPVFKNLVAYAAVDR